MNIDWFTFVAQIVNFLILVALLRWLLYDRILEAMQSRQERLAARLSSAEEAESRAERSRQHYESLRAEVNHTREQALSELQTQIAEQRDAMIREARDATDQLRRQWREELARDRQELLNTLRREAGSAGLRVAEHLVSKLGDAKLRNNLVQQFLRQLEQVAAEQRKEVAAQLAGDGAVMIVRTYPDLEPTQQQRIEAFLADWLESDPAVEFEEDPALVCGLELDAAGHCFGWNARDALQDLELEFEQQLERPPS
jgi:F-type H+-transporting ATPase subunit b